MTNKSEIDALVRAEVQRQLKAAQPTPYPDDAAVAAHRDRNHQMAEARASAFNPFTRDQLAAMHAAAPDDVCRDITRDARAPLSPSGIIPESEKGNARGPVNTTGWQHQIPLRNGIGQGK